MRGKNPSKQKTALTGINAVYNCFSFSSQFSTHIPMNLKYNRTFLMMENSLFSQSSKSPVVYFQSFLPTVSVISPFVSSIQSSLQSVDIHPRSFSTYYKIPRNYFLLLYYFLNINFCKCHITSSYTIFPPGINLIHFFIPSFR